MERGFSNQVPAKGPSVSKAEMELASVLEKIRDSTFRNAASLRAIADEALNRYRAGDFKEDNA